MILDLAPPREQLPRAPRLSRRRQGGMGVARRRRVRCLAALVMLGGCVESGRPVPPAPRYHDEPLFDVWAPDVQVGTVLLVDRRTSYGVDEIVTARFEPTGDLGIYSLLEEEGDCRLYTGRYDCVCDFDEQCVDGVCRPFPTFVPVGDIIVDGLGDRRHLFFDDTWQWYWGEPDGTADGMMRGDAVITVTAEGSDRVPGFTAAVAGVSGVTSNIDDHPVLELPEADEVELTWQAPDPAARVRLVLRTAEFDHFGYSNEKLVCDLPDRGSLRVPGSLVGRLPEMVVPPHTGPYAGGWPAVPSGLIRYRAARVDSEAGRIEVVAAVETLFWAIH
jgi:hypothetical protein